MIVLPERLFMQKETQKNTAALSPAIPERVAADPDQGLCTAQVQERMAAGLDNKPVSAPSKTVRQIIFSNVFTYFNLIFLVLAIALIWVRAEYSHLSFLVVIICNICIGTFQEIHSKRTLDKLNLLAAPHASAVRDGTVQQISTAELVLDDVVIFSAGNQICADADVIEGEAMVNESLITGEADEIVKRPGDKLLSGSFIISGKCKARLTHVGADSYVSRLTLEAKKMHKKKEVGITRTLTRLVQVIGVGIIPIGILLYLRQTIRLGLSVQDAVINTTAALIGMIPEGLYLLVSVALAVSVMRLARQKTLVHEMRCIEMLARVDVLCVDKTGTITSNEMDLTDVIALRSSGCTRENLCDILKSFSLNMDADNATIQAIKQAFPPESGGRAATQLMPFSSEKKYSALSLNDDEHYVLGAPEFILREKYAEYRSLLEPYTREGNRVLLLASMDRFPQEREPLGNVKPLGIVLLTNPIRPQAKETFSYFTQQNVAIKVISGDNPVTVACAAQKAAIPNAENYVDASTLTTPELIADAATRYTVFGRVTPEQKRQLVHALKAAGHTVAMTGDGVNDVPSLKEADCSIAMASGSEVASQVAQLVLLDSNFASMPAVVAEGRRVINNIERSASLFLVKNIFSVFLAIISILAVFSYPVTPAQLSLINAFTIGIPSFLLALEPNTKIVSGKFLRNVLTRAFPAALTNLTLVIGVLLFSFAFPQLHADEVSTISAIIMGIVGMLMLGRVCMPFNKKRAAMYVVLAIGLLIGLIFFGSFFSMTALTFGGSLVLAVMALLAYPAMRTYRFLTEKIVAGSKRFLLWLKNKITKMEI